MAMQTPTLGLNCVDSNRRLFTNRVRLCWVPGVEPGLLVGPVVSSNVGVKVLQGLGTLQMGETPRG